MPTPPLRYLLVALVMTGVTCGAHASAADSAEAVVCDAEASLDAIVARIAIAQDPRVAEALLRINGTGRRLLALRAYLRSKTQLAERWSWTAEQVAAYESTPEHGELQAEIERVRVAFAQVNPGFELWVNPQVRNLDIQLESWNRNESVAAAAEALQAAARKFVAGPAIARANPGESARAFEQFLTAHMPVPTPTIAAPGLSPHGQMRAIDFQVHKDGAVVAGTRTSTIAEDWDGAGWTHKLATAVRSATRHFVGPLESPREPWHYTYAPDAVAAR